MKLEGEIGELDLIERLVELGRERFTGAVRFENDGIIKIIYFKGGDILSASTNDRTDSVDEILLRAGKVSRDHVKQALAKRKENETLGDALLALGFITRKELTWGRRVQVIGVIRSIAAWPAGSFQIVPDYLPKREEGTQFPLQQILVEVVVTDQDRAKFDRAMDGGNAVFARSDEFDFEWAKLGLNQDADAIAAWIDGEHTAAEIASLSGKDAFNVYKLLHALTVLGLLKPRVTTEVSAPAFEAPPPPSPMRSAFDDEEEEVAPPTLEMPAITIPEPEPIAPIAPIEEEEIPPPLLPIAPMASSEPEWGFDEAQIETSRRATIEEPKPAAEVVAKASKGNRWISLLFAAVIVIALVFGGLAAWNWYQEKNAPPPAPVVVAKPRVRRPVPAPVATGTVTPTTATVAMQTQTTASVAPPPPAATPLVIKPPTPTAMKVTPNTTQITQTAAGAKTISNVAAAPPKPATFAAPSGDRSHYDEMAKTFLAQASGNYTVQFELVCETPSLTKAVKDGGSSVWFVPTSYRDRACYRVFWGHFTTHDEAARAAREIPMSLRGVAPVVVKVPKP